MALPLSKRSSYSKLPYEIRRLYSENHVVGTLIGNHIILVRTTYDEKQDRWTKDEDGWSFDGKARF